MNDSTDQNEALGADRSDDKAADEQPITDAEKLDAVMAERDDLLGRLQRVSADYLNYQKRAGREKAELRDYVVADVLGAMFDVMDDLGLAVDHARQNHPADDPLLVGTDMVYKKAMAVFQRFGVEPINTEQAAFDPALHEAVVSQPTDEAPPMTILQEIRKGYRMGERVIRPSRVVVAAPPEDTKNEPSNPAEK